MTLLHRLLLLLLLRPAAAALSLMNRNSNGSKDYPYCFSGRLWFRPSFVLVSSRENNLPAPPDGVSILSLFGWTIGGVVALEYDDSPVGPYREYVTMGALVFKGGALGQWGSRLYVSTKEAEDVCREIWNVPAEEADIQFLQGGEKESLFVAAPPDSAVSQQAQIVVNGWRNSQILRSDDSKTRWGALPVLWTPSIKALWAPIRAPFTAQSRGESLPLHKLRLSASALRLRTCGQASSKALGVPWSVGLVVDNILIEIAPQNGSL